VNASSKKPGRLGHSRRIALYTIGIGVWLSGGLWLVFHYFLVKEGEFGPTANPLEPWWLKLHGAFAFAAIWIFGLMWGVHITDAWPHKHWRWSGGVLAGVFAFLIVSGYLLYYAGDDRVRPIVSVLHWGIGLACPIFFVAHRLHLKKYRYRQPMLSAPASFMAQTVRADALADGSAPVAQRHASDAEDSR
jgi:hypothetical protein